MKKIEKQNLIKNIDKKYFPKYTKSRESENLNKRR